MPTETGSLWGCDWTRHGDGTDREVIERLLRELFVLFDLSAEQTAELSVELYENPGEPPLVRTSLGVCDGGILVCEGTAAADESFRAAVHRLFKLHLYDMLRRKFSLPPAPWGIMHGVRPAKIVHRWLDGGAEGRAVIARLANDYAVSRDKAELLTEVALRQRPFLAVTDSRSIGVYVGIPFCLSRCLYCSFPAYVLPSRAELQKFMAVLNQDIKAAAREISRYGFKVQSIYVGGGTPTALPDDLFADMLKLVRDLFVGDTTAEFTVEAGRPDSMSAAKINCLQSCGVTRVSVNPQTMQERTLKLIGRRHTPDDILTMYSNLRRNGTWQINMDVILGLPGETHSDVADTIDKLIALRPDDITLHALALKKGSRLKLALDSKSQSNQEIASGLSREIKLPDDNETHRMSEVALAAIRKAGLRPYYLYRQGYMRGGLENIGCARPGAESIYNIQIMEERQTILGVGSAAVTKVADKNFGGLRSAFNAKDLTTYLRDIDMYIDKRARLLRGVYGD